MKLSLRVMLCLLALSNKTEAKINVMLGTGIYLNLIPGYSLKRFCTRTLLTLFNVDLRFEHHAHKMFYHGLCASLVGFPAVTKDVFPIIPHFIARIGYFAGCPIYQSATKACYMHCGINWLGIVLKKKQYGNIGLYYEVKNINPFIEFSFHKKGSCVVHSLEIGFVFWRKQKISSMRIVTYSINPMFKYKILWKL